MGLAIALLYLFTNASELLLVGAFGDDGVYAVLGKAIASGDGYRSLHLTGTPVHGRFPPGFPVVMAALWQIGGTIERVYAMLVPIQCVVIGVTVALLWHVARVRFAATPAVAAALVVTPFVLDAAMTYNAMALAEPWYLLACSLAIVVWYRTPDSPSPGLRSIIVLGLLAAAAMLFRTVAIALIPAVAAGLLKHKVPARMLLLFCVIALAPALPSSIWIGSSADAGSVASLGEEMSYGAWLRDGASFGEYLKVPGANIREYVSTLGPHLSSQLGTWIAAGALLALLAASVGAVRVAQVPAVFAAVTAAILILWPSPQDRLLLSWLPFAGLVACERAGVALRRIAHNRVRRAAGWSLALGAALVAVHQLDVRREAIGVVTGAPQRYFTPLRGLIGNSVYIAQVSRWMRSNAQPSDRTMTEGGAGVFLYSGHVANPLTTEVSRLSDSPGSRTAGEYLAGRILRDSITLIVAGPVPEIAREINAIDRRCGGLASVGGPPLSAPVVVLRVRTDPACLRRLATLGREE